MPPRRTPEHGENGLPRRELDVEKTGERAKAPPNLIRRPIKPPPMKRVQQ